jgi:uncharacterized membrane protein YfcA
MQVVARGRLTNNVAAVVLVVAAGIPAALLSAGIVAFPSEIATLVFGLGIVSAAFTMSWGAEAARARRAPGARAHRRRAARGFCPNTPSTSRWR